MSKKGPGVSCQWGGVVNWVNQDGGKSRGKNRSHEAKWILPHSEIFLPLSLGSYGETERRLTARAFLKIRNTRTSCQCYIYNDCQCSTNYLVFNTKQYLVKEAVSWGLEEIEHRDRDTAKGCRKLFSIQSFAKQTAITLILNRTPAWTKSMWQGLWRTASRQRLSNIFWCSRRCISTTYLDPSLRAFTSSLVQQQPVFELPSSSIQILAEPSQFYKTLLVFIFRIHLRSYLTFGRTWLNELNAEYSSPRSTLIPQSLSLCVIFIYFLPSFQCFNGIDFYAGKPPSRKAWSESLSFTWPEPFNASGSIMRNKFFTPSITRLSITCTYFNVSKSQLTRYSRQNSPSTF